MNTININNPSENTVDVLSDEEKKKGKIPVRQHLYNLGVNYGLKKEDIDNIIKYDNATGEIKLGDMNYGKPFSVVDGVSYDDQSKVETAWKDYAQHAGLTEGAKIPVRKHLYKLGENYGLNKADMDNIIKYDDATGEIKLGWMNYGKPFEVVDGVSYDDEANIQSKWKEYAQQTGIKERGKTPVREYLYTLGGNYGLSKEDMDNIIKYDTDTGEIFLGGMNIGKPSSVVSGVSYDDEANIRTAMENYAERAGLKKRPNDLYHSLIEGNADKLQQQWDENTKHYDSTRQTILDKLTEFGGNITDDQDFKTIAKSIYDKFDYDALVARDNAIAGGAADNGGNIDSYAAANAIRQQAALRNQGINAAVNAGLGVVGQKRADQISMLDKLTGEDQAYFDRQSDNINTGMGMAQQVFDNDETSKHNQWQRDETSKHNQWQRDEGSMNNRVDRDVKLTGASGYNSGLVKYSHNELFNQDGSLKNINKDYKADYNVIKERYDATTDPEEKMVLKAALNKIAEAHNWKVLNIPEYSGYDLLPTYDEISLDRYLGDFAAKVAMGEATAIENAEKIKAESAWNKAVLDNQTKITTTQMDNDTDYAINERKIENDEMKLNKDKNEEIAKSNVDSNISTWLYSIEGIGTKEPFYSGWDASTNLVYAARDKLNNSDAYTYMKNELLRAGYDNDEALDKIREWRMNIMVKAANQNKATVEDIANKWGGEWKKAYDKMRDTYSDKGMNKTEKKEEK